MCHLLLIGKFTPETPTSFLPTLTFFPAAQYLWPHSCNSLKLLLSFSVRVSRGLFEVRHSEVGALQLPQTVCWFI